MLKTWEGVNVNYFDETNWDDGLPTSDDDIEISTEGASICKVEGDLIGKSLKFEPTSASQMLICLGKVLIGQ